MKEAVSVQYVGRGEAVAAPERARRPQVAPRVEPSSPHKPGWLERILDVVRTYRHRDHAEHFRWNVPAQRVGKVRAEAVYCVELPVSDPVGVLASYMQSGVKSDHVVFVGDPLTMTDDAYNRITQQGALVQESKKHSRRQQTQEELAPYYAQVRAAARPKTNPNKYTYDPGTPAVTREQIQALIDEIASK